MPPAFVRLLLLFLLLFPGCERAKKSNSDPGAAAIPPRMKLPPELDAEMRKYFAAREAQARKLVEFEKQLHHGNTDQPAAIKKGQAPEVWPFFEAGKRGDWPKVQNLYFRMGGRSYHFSNEKTDEQLTTLVWQPINETYRAYEQMAAAPPKYLQRYADEISATIPPGGVLFAGSDAGRFVSAFKMWDRPPEQGFYIVSQNALVDSLYLDYLGSLYAKSVALPSREAADNAFVQTIEEIQRKCPSKVRVTNDVMEVLDGDMAIDLMIAYFAKEVVEQNPDKAFYMDGERGSDWMFPHLEPAGFIFKFNRKPAELSAGAIRADRKFWDKQVSDAIGSWLSEQTTLHEISWFARQVYLRKDLTGFDADPEFVGTARIWRMLRDFEGASAVYSQARSNIARLYWLRSKSSKSPKKRDQLLQEADYAFRQAFALCPYQSRTTGNYIHYLFDQKRYADLLLVAQTAEEFGPHERWYEDWVRDAVGGAQTNLTDYRQILLIPRKNWHVESQAGGVAEATAVPRITGKRLVEFLNQFPPGSSWTLSTLKCHFGIEPAARVQHPAYTLFVAEFEDGSAHEVAFRMADNTRISDISMKKLRPKPRS